MDHLTLSSICTEEITLTIASETFAVTRADPVIRRVIVVNTILTSNRRGDRVGLGDIALVRLHPRIVLIETPDEIALEQMPEPFQESVIILAQHHILRGCVVDYLENILDAFGEPLCGTNILLENLNH